MPEHASWFTLALAHMRDTLDHNTDLIGKSFIGKQDATWQSFEPLAASVAAMVVVIVLAAATRARLADPEKAVIPDDHLTLRTFMESFLGYFYDLAKGVMDAERAKKYFPLIGTSAIFVFFANALALIPGFPIATSHLNITFGCAAIVFVAFNAYGIAANGAGYIKHLMGPSLWLAPLVLPIEIISLCVRPVTLGVRLMMNMAVDHLLVGTFMGLVALAIPIPVMLLECLVIIVQTLVFTLLTVIYIGLATEHEEHAH
jgi:F-type H+-transporting ATPase subunit a